MTAEEAIKIVCDRFPFEGYIHPESGAHLNIAKTILRFLEPGGKILDFGSGPCDKTAVMQTLSFVCSAYDDLQDDWHKTAGNKDKILAFARDFGIDFRVGRDDHPPFENNSFDMLMMHDVLEHLHDSPRDLLNDLLEFVRPDGYLFVTVPNAVNIRKRIDVLFGRTNYPRFEVFYWYPGPWRGHVREYTKDDLAKLAKYLGLHIEEIQSCHHVLEKLPTMARPIYKAVTTVFKGWRDSWMLVARKKADWSPNKSLPHNRLKEILASGGAYQ